MRLIYMDNAATSWPKPEAVYMAQDRFNREIGANPGRGSHRRTVEAGLLVLETREALAQLFGIRDSSHIAFAQNVTHALNYAMKGILKPGDHVIISSMEHNAVARPLTSLQRSGVSVTIIPCSPEGRLNPSDVEKAIRPDTRMIILTQASNLIGTIMPIAEVGQIARAHDVLFLVDAAQGAGILPIDVERDLIDLLAFTGHKGLMGPQGTGGLYIRPGLEVRPLIEGGTGSLSESLEQPDFFPDCLESGTPNTPGLVGLGAGVRFVLETGLDVIRRHELELTEALLQGLRSIPNVIVYGSMHSEDRTAVVSINIEGMDCGLLSYRLDQEYGIITRSGMHCAPLAHRTIGTTECGTCRISPGYFNTLEEVEQVLRAVTEIARDV